MKKNSPAKLLATVALVALAGCASVPQTKAERAEASAVNDPFESVNRAIFDVNDFMDRLLLRPLAELYRVMIPPPIRDRVAAILKNMEEPVIAANSLMQGRVTDAGVSVGRLAVNSTVGLGGMFEVASEWRLPRQSADFGQTLHSWGLGSGPYLVLPLFGPSNIRDAVGLGADTVMSPWQYIVGLGDSTIEDSYTITDMSASALVKREANIEGLDALREGSLDFYAQMRSVYRQYRAKQLGEPLASDNPVFDDYDSSSDSNKPIMH